MTPPDVPRSGPHEDPLQPSGPPARSGDPNLDGAEDLDTVASPEELAASELLDRQLGDQVSGGSPQGPATPPDHATETPERTAASPEDTADARLVARMQAAREELRAVDPPDEAEADALVAAALAAASGPATGSPAADGADADVVALGSRTRRPPRTSTTWLVGAAAVVVLVISGVWVLTNMTDIEDFASMSGNDSMEAGTAVDAEASPELGSEYGGSTGEANQGEPEAPSENTDAGPAGPSSEVPPEVGVAPVSLLVMLWQQIQAILHASTP